MSINCQKNYLFFLLFKLVKIKINNMLTKIIVDNAFISGLTFLLVIENITIGNVCEVGPLVK